MGYGRDRVAREGEREGEREMEGADATMIGKLIKSAKEG